MNCNRLEKRWSDDPDKVGKKPCPQCGHATSPKQKNVKRTIITSIGEVTYSRHAYYCPKCKTPDYPADEKIKSDLGHGSMTQDLTDLALDFAMNDPYEIAAERFKVHHGVELSRSGFQRIVEEASEKIAQKKR